MQCVCHRGQGADGANRIRDLPLYTSNTAEEGWRSTCPICGRSERARTALVRFSPRSGGRRIGPPHVRRFLPNITGSARPSRHPCKLKVTVKKERT